MIEDEIQEYDSSRQTEFLKEANSSQQDIINYQKNCKAYENYMVICKKEAELIKKLAGPFQDDRMYMAIFVYLYANGFLSTNKHFEFGYDNTEISCNCGLSVITGKGVCRNIAAHFKDVLIEIKNTDDKKSGVAFVGTNIRENRDCVVTRSELPEEFQMAHDTEKKENTRQTRKRDFLPNHAEILVMYADNSLMLYDPTNIRITKIDYATETDERIALDMRPNIFDCNSHLKTVQDREDTIKRFGRIAERFERSKREVYSKDDIKKILEFARRQCNSQKELLENFYKKHKMWYSIIQSQKEDYYKSQQETKDKEER